MKFIHGFFTCLLFLFSPALFAADFSLPSNTWKMISLPAAPPEDKRTIKQIFGDDIAGQYREEWALFEYDTHNKRYREMNDSDALKQGKGYWIIQVVSDTATLDMPEGSTENTSVSVPLASSDGQEGQWNMVGTPFPSPRPLSDLKIKGTDICVQACDLNEANQQGLAHNQAWFYTGTGYDALHATDTVSPWEGLWIYTLPGSRGHVLSWNGGGSVIPQPIVIIGPSTVFFAHELNEAIHADGSDCRLEGWGERLYGYAANDDMASMIYNYAQPGASAQTFLEPPDGKDKFEQMLYGPERDHYWAKAKEKMQQLGKGTLLIQFGGNDARLLLGTPVQRENAFKEDIQFYIDEAKNLNFTPVLITSIERRLRNPDGSLKRSRGDFPRWMKEIGQQNGLRVLDLNQKSYEEYGRYTDAQFKEKFADCYSRWGKDAEGNRPRQNTHFEPKGAKIAASWIRDLACEQPDSLLCKQLAGTPEAFTLHSTDKIPPRGIPSLQWGHAPKGTKGFAIVVDDHDSHNPEHWVHWVAVNINPTSRSVEAGQNPAGALILNNQDNNAAYGDPAHPEDHLYEVHLYALDIKDITRTTYANREPIFQPDKVYNHLEFEKTFGNFILEKADWFYACPLCL